MEQTLLINYNVIFVIMLYNSVVMLLNFVSLCRYSGIYSKT